MIDIKTDCTVNGIPLSSFGGSALLDYVIGGTEINNSYFLGQKRTNPSLLRSVPAMRSIEITIVFAGRTLHEARINQSRLNAELCGESVLYIPDDGFYYQCICDKLGNDELVGIGDYSAKVKTTYSLRGFRRGPLQSVTVAAGGTIYCEGTMPRMDCRLTSIPSGSAASYRVGGAYFANVQSGNVLVFDGINGMITNNGVSAAGTATWSEFPYLVPGANVIQASGPVTVEYYPVYI